MTWTDEAINEYSIYLDRQEQLVLQALDMGYDSVEDVEQFVRREMGECDRYFVEMVYNVRTHPDRKVPLEVL